MFFSHFCLNLFKRLGFSNWFISAPKNIDLCPTARQLHEQSGSFYIYAAGFVLILRLKLNVLIFFSDFQWLDASKNAPIDNILSKERELISNYHNFRAVLIYFIFCSSILCRLKRWFITPSWFITIFFLIFQL